ncbi:MAG: hypothetical protein SPE21_00320 [Candidatus Cryptobacteroides sp.]|nr:hypothetical protein [Candidatus Cryptobacteroides sp.]
MKPGICIMALAAALLLGCSKTEVRDSIEIVSVSETSFSSEGGLGTIWTSTGGIAVEAVSSAPQWLTVSTVREKVLFKILPNDSPEERRASFPSKPENSREPLWRYRNRPTADYGCPVLMWTSRKTSGRQR